jgi:hypothetical protein
MSEIPIKTYKENRRTYVKGDFTGKFHGLLDNSFALSQREKYFDIHFTEIKVENLKNINETEYTDMPVEICCTDNIPTTINCFVDGLAFKLNLNLPKVNINSVIDVLPEAKERFGTIKGIIYAYVEDEIEINVQMNPSNLTGNFELKGEDGQNYRRDEYEHSNGKSYWGDWYKIYFPKEDLIKDVETGNFESEKRADGIYRRYEYYKSDQTTYWNDWTLYQAIREPWWQVVLRTFFYLFIGGLFLSITPIVWPFFVIIGVIWFFNFLSNRYKVVNNIFSKTGTIVFSIFGYGFSLLSLFFLLFTVFAFYNGCNKRSSTFLPRTGNNNHNDRSYVPRQDNDVPRISPSPEQNRNDNNNNKPQQDSLIINTLRWTDYHNNYYIGNIIVRVSNYLKSRKNRNTITPSEESAFSYWNSIYTQLVVKDYSNLDRVYVMFDNIRKKHNLNSKEFADVIVSCIQTIPYVLVVNDECNSNKYNQKSIKEYINNGGDCQCCTRFGLYAPTEFFGNLKGDCDTRTVALFTILTRFGYDAVVLNSNYFGHSIIGVNMQTSGVYKKFKNKKYYVWETTSKGFQLGELPPDVANMNLWNVILANN